MAFIVSKKVICETKHGGHKINENNRRSLTMKEGWGPRLKGTKTARAGGEKTRAFSAVAVPAENWKKVFASIKEYRRGLKDKHKIFVTVEWHASEFVGGRGRIAPVVIPKGLRCAIFRDVLCMVATRPGVRMFNAMAPRMHERLIFERLIMRINNTMKTWKSNALIVHDEGKDYTPMVRRMGVYNPIQSKYGAWDDGNLYKDIPVERILEDIFFRDSADSYFIQLADFCAYALFRSEHPLSPPKAKYQLETAFNGLDGILTPECFGKDPKKRGIIRET